MWCLLPHEAACLCAMAIQSCPTLSEAMTLCSSLGPSLHGISRQESWSGLPFPSRGDLLDPGIEPTSLMSLALAGGSFTTEPPGKPPQPFPSHVCEGAWVPGVDTGQQDPPSLDPHWPIKYSPSHMIQTMTLHVYEVKHSVLQSHPPHFTCSVASCGQVPWC